MNYMLQEIPINLHRSLKVVADAADMIDES